MLANSVVVQVKFEPHQHFNTGLELPVLVLSNGATDEVRATRCWMPSAIVTSDS